jgi:hypothetical protein
MALVLMAQLLLLLLLLLLQALPALSGLPTTVRLACADAPWLTYTIHRDLVSQTCV